MTDLATLDDLAAALEQDVADPTDRRMVTYLAAASNIVRQYTGQDFDLKVDDVVKLDGTGTMYLQLPQLPVLDVGAIVQYDYYDAIISQPTTFLTRLDTKPGLLVRVDDSWGIGWLNWSVTYSHGYVLPGTTYTPDVDHTFTPEPLPQLVRQKTAAIAAALYGLDFAGGLIQQEVIGAYQVTYSSAMAATGGFEPELKSLAHYRVIDAA